MSIGHCPIIDIIAGNLLIMIRSLPFSLTKTTSTATRASLSAAAAIANAAKTTANETAAATFRSKRIHIVRQPATYLLIKFIIVKLLIINSK